MKYITKKTTLLLLALPIVVVLSVIFVDYIYKLSSATIDVLSIIVLLAYWIISLFLPFLFTLPLKPTVFKAWRLFAIFAIPITTVIAWLLLLADLKTGGGGWGIVSLSLTPFILGLIYLIYFIISLVIIIRAWRRSRRGQVSS